jgi:hypothetical protein
MSLKECWANALMSGNYSQNKLSAHLYYNNKFSCIGVACNVFNVPCRIIRDEDEITDIYYGVDQEEFNVPKELRELFKDIDLDKIATWDSNFTFTQIANKLINDYI